jgi:hypothetical protein
MEPQPQEVSHAYDNLEEDLHDEGHAPSEEEAIHDQSAMGAIDAVMVNAKDHGISMKDFEDSHWTTEVRGPYKYL